MKIGICDDNEKYTEEIKRYTKDFLTVRDIEFTITEFGNGIDLVEYCKKNVLDILMIDIEMPVMDGFKVVEILQELQHDLLIVFITSHEDLVFQSWKYQPFWFVRKSCLDDLNIVLPRLVKKYKSISEKRNPIFKFILGNKSEELNINTVKYIQAYKHYIIIKDKTQGDIQLRCKISDAERQLSSLRFVRVQNSVIVNCRFIETIPNFV